MATVQPPPGISLERMELNRTTLDEIAVVATEAFADDPFFGFLLPGEAIRRRALRIFFRSMVSAASPVAVVHGARDGGGRLVGVAVFVRPGGWPLPIAAQVRQLGHALSAMIPRPRALVDGTRYLFAIETIHPKGELWYLMLLGVDPSAQRGGIGGALQSQVYPQADAEGLDSYLETQKEANLAYYRRFGYETEKELRPVKGGPSLWTMRRAPRPPEE
jgi:GNAT superfamily N-acetyltransferase